MIDSEGSNPNKKVESVFCMREKRTALLSEDDNTISSQQSYTVIIKEGKDLTIKSMISTSSNLVTVAMMPCKC
jgi:hypothetical protein